MPSASAIGADARPWWPTRGVSAGHPRGYTVPRALLLGARAAWRHRGLTAVLLVATLSQGALQGLLVWLLREVLVRFSQGQVSIVALLLGASVILVVWLLRATGTYFGEVVAQRLTRRVEVESMQRVLATLLSLPVRFFERSSHGDLVMTAYEDLKGIKTVMAGVSTVVLSASRLLGLAVVAWVMSPALAALGLIAVPAGVIPAYFLGQRITRAAHRERGAIETLYDAFLQVSTGIRPIKVSRGEATILRRAGEIGDGLYRHAVKKARERALSRLLLEGVSGFGLIAVLVVGGREVGMGQLDWQSLLSLIIAVVAVYTPILSLLTVYGQIRGIIPNLERIDVLLATPPEPPDPPRARRVRDAPETITLADISFGYDEQPVLHRISAEFHRGETIGIVGRSGSGKSTLCGLMLRLYEPTGGRILWDGVDLRVLRRADVLDRCMIVLQEPFLFADTIANNIRIARPDAPIEDVVAAAKAARIHAEIVEMANGYDTPVGQSRSARGLSVGQKQRVCIAAALLKNAPMLFLDEATSNLDAVSERSVQEAIDRLMAGRTTFLIAHRFSTLRTADRILVLDRGRLAGLGTHEELVRDCAVYRELLTNQALDGALERAASRLSVEAVGSNAAARSR